MAAPRRSVTRKRFDSFIGRVPKGVRAIALFENASFSHGLYRFSRWEDLPADS